MGYRDDKPTRFHDIVEVEKANANANAAIMYSGKNPALAEWFLDKIKFQYEASRSEYQTQVVAGATKATLQSISGRMRQIEHIHANCAEHIMSSWQLPTDDEANLQLLQDLRKKASGKDASAIDFLIHSLGGEVSQNSLDEWYGVHTFILGL